TIHAVQCGQSFTRCGTADHDRSLQAGRIVAVNALAELEHDVVGDVDGQRDGAHSGELDAALQPARAWRRRVEPGHRTGGENRTPGRIVDTHRMIAAVESWHPELPWVGPVQAIGRRDLARHASHRQAVPAVRRDCDVQDVLADASQLD